MKSKVDNMVKMIQYSNMDDLYAQIDVFLYNDEILDGKSCRLKSEILIPIHSRAAIQCSLKEFVEAGVHYLWYGQLFCSGISGKRK